MKVETLMDYYNALNTATTQASIASASNKTQANIESARIGQDAKRLEQEKQLEFFKQKMEDMRNARSMASAEQLAAKRMDFDTGQGILDKEFTSGQNAATREFNLKLQQMSDAQAMERDKMKAEREAPVQAAQIRASEASTAKSEAETAAIGQVNPKDIIDTYVALQKQPKEGLLWTETERDKARQVTMKALEDQMAKFGINPETNPDIQSAKGPDVKARYEKELSGIDNYFKAVAKDGKMASLQQKWALLKAKLANGKITPAQYPAARAKFIALAKSYGVSEDEFGI